MYHKSELLLFNCSKSGCDVCIILVPELVV